MINMSFVMSGPDAGVAAALEHARSKGVLIVAAAGNNGSADVTFPAGQPGVVSVTGTDSADGRYEWATYGNWVTLAAPGCSQSTQAGGGYADFCGTSSAAAFTSGVAALARSAARDASVDQIVSALSSNAVPRRRLRGHRPCRRRGDRNGALRYLLRSCCPCRQPC